MTSYTLYEAPLPYTIESEEDRAIVLEQITEIQMLLKKRTDDEGLRLALEERERLINK